MVIHPHFWHAFLEHRKILAAYLAKKLLDPADIEDILQETFVSACERGSNNSTIRSPKAYLFIVARNLLSKQLADQSRKVMREVDDVDITAIPAEAASPEQQIEARLKLQYFKKSVLALPRQCRRVFLLRKIYGWPHKKIALRLGISTSTVERHITIALTRLDAQMNKHSNLTEGGPEHEHQHRNVKKS